MSIILEYLKENMRNFLKNKSHLYYIIFLKEKILIVLDFDLYNTSKIYLY